MQELVRLATVDVRAALPKVAFERLASVVPPTDVVVAVALATRDGRWWKELLPKSYLAVVATDRRLLLVPAFPGLVNEESEVAFEAIEYREIIEVREKTGKLESKLTILSPAGQTRLTSMRAPAVRTLAQAIRERV